MLIKKINTYVLNHINSTAKQYKASSSLRACFCCLWWRLFPFPQEKLQSCLKVTLKSIRRTSRAWSTRFAPKLTGANQRKGGIHKGGKEISFSLRVHMRACPHCTEKCVRQLDRFCTEKSGRQLDRFCSSGRGCVKGLLTEKQSLHVFLTNVRKADHKV